MVDFDSLIGLKESDAKQILTSFGYKNIITVINSKQNQKCDTMLVCAVRQNKESKEVTLICGEFFINIER